MGEQFGPTMDDLRAAGVEARLRPIRARLDQIDRASCGHATPTVGQAVTE